MIATAKDLRKLIQQAQEWHAKPEEIEELREHLKEIESGMLTDCADSTFVYEKIEDDNSRVVYFSTAPINPQDDDDFEGVTFKSV